MSTLAAKQAEAGFSIVEVPAEPSGAFLLRMLRDPELRRAVLPDFHWHFPECGSCAMGLAHQLWGTLYSPSVVGKIFGIGPVAAYEVLINGGMGDEVRRLNEQYGMDPANTRAVRDAFAAITPEQIADMLDAAVAARAA